MIISDRGWELLEEVRELLGRYENKTASLNIISSELDEAISTLIIVKENYIVEEFEYDKE